MKRTKRYIAGMCVSMLLACLPAGWAVSATAVASQSKPQKMPQFSKEELAALRAMKASATCTQDAIESIDLTKASNELAYRALMREAGAKKWVFDSIEPIKQAQLALKSQRKELPRFREIYATGDANKVPQNYFSLLGITGTPDWKKTRAVLYSTVYYTTGQIQVQDTLTLFNADPQDPESDGDVIGWGDSDPENEAVRNNVLGSYSPDDINNPDEGPVSGYATFQALINGHYYPPVHTCTIKQSKPQFQSLVMTKPTRTQSYNPKERPVIICLNRADIQPPQWTDACDYGPLEPGVSNDKLEVWIPLAGSGTLSSGYSFYRVNGKPAQNPSGKPWSVDISVSDAGQIPVGSPVNTATGGACLPANVQDDFWKHASMSAYWVDIGWRYDADPAVDPAHAYANFGPVCYRSGQNYTLTMMVTAGLADAQGKFKGPVQFSFTNDPAVKQQCFGDNTVGYDCGNVVLLPNVQIQYGCVVEGTLVSMREGPPRKIEDLKPGEWVRTDDGRSVRIRAMTTGTDSHITTIVAQDGARVQLTWDHPVKTGRGMLPARDVRTGDTVFGINGPTVVTSVENAKLEKTVNVYNLALEAPDSADAVFYAGSLLVGDNEAQGRLGRAAAAQ